VAQLAQRLGFDLANALAGDGKGLADLLERVLAAVLQAKAHLDDLSSRGVIVRSTPQLDVAVEILNREANKIPNPFAPWAAPDANELEHWH
jgi:hypothetical protein